MNEPRVYKTSPLLLILIAIVFLFFLGIVWTAFGSALTQYAIPVLAFMAFIFGLLFISLTSKTIVSDDEISVQGLFGAKTLRWMEIGHVSGWGGTMKLHSRDDDVKLSISSRMPGYLEVIEAVGAKRPELFSPRDYPEMRRGLGFFTSLGVFLLLFLGFIVFFVSELLASGNLSVENLIPFAILFLMLLAFVGMFLSAPRVVLMEGDQLTLRYILSERIIHASEVSFVQLRYTQTRNGRHYFIFLQLTNGKSIKISGMSLSLPIAYLVLRNWQQGKLHI